MKKSSTECRGQTCGFNICCKVSKACTTALASALTQDTALIELYYNEPRCTARLQFIPCFLDDIMMEWNRQADPMKFVLVRIQLSIVSILFADDEVIITGTEDDLQYGTHTLDEIAKT